MRIDIALITTFAAIAVMLYCLLLAFSLKKDIPGGVVGKQWRMLELLVLLFALGYLATPFAGALPEEVLRLIVSLIFLFGAIYVVITVKLIHRIINVLSSGALKYGRAQDFYQDSEGQGRNSDPSISPARQTQNGVAPRRSKIGCDAFGRGGPFHCGEGVGRAGLAGLYPGNLSAGCTTGGCFDRTLLCRTINYQG